MVDADKPHFSECVTELSIVHRQTVSKEMIQAYWKALSDMSLQDFDHAMKHLRKKAMWFPKPAEFWAMRRAGYR